MGGELVDIPTVAQRARKNTIPPKMISKSLSATLDISSAHLHFEATDPGINPSITQIEVSCVSSAKANCLPLG